MTQDLRVLIYRAFKESGWDQGGNWVKYPAIVKVVNEKAERYYRASIIERMVRQLAQEGILEGNGKGFFKVGWKNANM